MNHKPLAPYGRGVGERARAAQARGTTLATLREAGGVEAAGRLLYPAAMSPDQPYAGHVAAGTHRFAVRVYYEDTDAGGVVYHANYLRFMERARTDMLALCGVHLGEALAAGRGTYVVTDATLRFRRPARLGDALLVTSHMVETKAASCVIHQAVSRDGEEVVDGRVTVAFVGADGRPRRQPAEWIAAFAAMRGA